MLKKIINRETIAYIICGGLTTLINILVFGAMNRTIGESNIIWSETIAFIIATLFAYITNKYFVFRQKNTSTKAVIQQILTFFTGRIISYGIDLILMIGAKDILHAGSIEILHINGLTIAKIPVATIVIIINYIFSKIIVFHK